MALGNHGNCGGLRESEQLEVLASNYDLRVAEIVLSMFASDTRDELKKMIAEGMVAVPPEVGIGAMRGMVEDIPLFEVARDLNYPKLTINATARPMDEAAAREAGIDVRFVPTNGHFVMNEDPHAFNQILGEGLERMFE